MSETRPNRCFRRQATWVAIATCLVFAAASFAAGPPPRRIDSFLGLWEGIDSQDGSPVRLSLTDLNDDGVIEQTLQEDFFTVCFDLGPTYSQGRGMVIGTGTVVGRNTLEVETELICIDDSNETHSLGTGTLQYTLRSKDRVLVLPQIGDSPPIPLHRTAL